MSCGLLPGCPKCFLSFSLYPHNFIRLYLGVGHSGSPFSDTQYAFSICNFKLICFLNFRNTFLIIFLVFILFSCFLFFKDFYYPCVGFSFPVFSICHFISYPFTFFNSFLFKEQLSFS